MRLKTEFWVKAYVRRCMGAGIIATVLRHGDDDAGAVFVKLNRLDGTAAVFGPAPIGSGEDRGDRRLAPHMEPGNAAEAAVDAYLARQVEYDPDIWIVEVEDRQGRHMLDPELA